MRDRVLNEVSPKWWDFYVNKARFAPLVLEESIES